MHPRLAPLFTVLFLGLSLPAQGPPAAPGGAAPRAPESAEDSCRTLLAAIQQGDATALWDFLPAGYQQDVNGIVHLLATKVDPKVYDSGMQLFGRVVTLLQNKKPLFFGSKLGQMALQGKDAATVQKAYDEFTALLATLTTSDLAHHGKLARFDGREFLQTTGGDLLHHLVAMAGVDGKDPFAALASMEVKTVQQTADKATLRFTAKGKPASTEQYVAVEDRWLPAKMVAQWQKGMAEAKKDLAKLADGGDKQGSAQARMMLGMAESVVQQLEDADTQEQFDEVLQGLMAMRQRSSQGTAQKGR